MIGSSSGSRRGGAVVLEEKLSKWIQAGLALYRAEPRMLEAVFFDFSQVGFPTQVAPALLVDLEKLWLPDEWRGGTLRLGGETFPIVGNTGQQLSVTGDPSSVAPEQRGCYQIVPPSVQGLTEFLQTQTFEVLTTFAQVPTHMPSFTIRLEKDAPGDAYVGDSLQTYAENGVEFTVRSQGLTGNYLMSIWTINRDATLWLYAWLMTYSLQSIGMFGTWGLYDVALSGSDLDPALQYLAERSYVRHLLLTATRTERAVTTREPVEWVSDWCLKLFTHYQTFVETIPTMD
jgi:hypothetical protein